MANKRIYELTEDTTPAANDFLATDVSGAAAALKVNLNKFVLADGTITGATSQAQDFGSNGVKADVIAESTGAAGVTIDGVLLKDSDIVLTAGQVIKPTADSTSSLKLAKADETAVLTLDTTNSRIGIAASPSAYTLSVGGDGQFIGTSNPQLRCEYTGGATVKMQSLSTSATFGTESNHSCYLNVNNSQKMVIDTSGNVKVASTGFATGKFHIDQESTTATLPVLVLDQGDVDEPLIKFIGTAASADLTRSIVAEADVNTATRAGFVKVEVSDDGNQITDQDYFMPVFTLA
jgi:hypothetical protein